MSNWMTQSFDDMEGYEALFFEPRSISADWDLSELLEPSPRQSHPKQASWQAGQGTPGELHQPSQDPTLPEPWKMDCEFEPFPEPRTMPSRWDISELF